ncbi:MAG TPA: hypothetical protein VN131_04460 [Mobilitalea sp.]|nr:hypothetical protein [Mobilitalea sp.]
MKSLTQQFNDGVLSVYTVGNIAEDGDMPKQGLTLKQDGLRYEERTVGMSRFWTAKQNSSTVEQMLRVPRINGISLHDVAIPRDGEQYDIVQIQFINDVEPRSIDLSLQKVSAAYDIKGY